MRMIILLIAVVCCVTAITAEKTDRNKENNCKSNEKDEQDGNVKKDPTAKNEPKDKTGRENKENKTSKGSNEDKKEKESDIDNKKDESGDKKHDKKTSSCHCGNSGDDKKRNEKTSDCHCEKPQACPDVCPFYVDPICALPDKWCAKPKTFSNPCFLAAYNCKNPKKKYKFFHDGGCYTTPSPVQDCGLIDCPFIEKPICGLPKDFCAEPMTFATSCNMDVHNCFNPNEQYTYFHDGECLTTTTPVPEPNCAAISCLNDGKTICGLPNGFCGQPESFANACEMEYYNCVNPNNKYKFFHDGECLAVSIPEPEPQCDIVCLDSYNPICALLDDSCGQPRTFGNECSLEAHNCENKNQKYKKFHDGECITTPAPGSDCGAIDCPFDYTPICGIPKGIPDGFCAEPMTFSNSCDMEVHNCFHPDEQYKYFHDGECIPQPPVCPEICPDNYEPICATGPSGDKRRFSNKCDFESHNCLNTNNQYTYAYDGECNECSDIQCNKIYYPVCASNSKGILKTFGNPCMLQWNNCECPDDLYTYSYDGECNPIICTEEYNPVCATSATLGDLTFPNKCKQDAYISEHPEEGYSPAYDGECKPKCWKPCTKEYMPICGKNCDGTLQTFDNQCFMDNYNCEHPNDLFTTLYNGKCKPVCNDACTREYRPVCGRDSEGNTETFSNKCVFESYICNHPEEGYAYLSEGECKPNCLKICTAIDSPICGTDSNGKTETFRNQCEFDNYNCEHPNEKYITFTNGKCKVVCNDQCPEINKPVCGSMSGSTKDKKAITFLNQCKLDAYNCHNPKKQYIKAADGECPVNCKTLECPDKEKWICAVPNGFEGKPSSFYNDCERQLHNCANPKDKYYFFADGKCDNGC